jgi:hypothetical protein
MVFRFWLGSEPTRENLYYRNQYRLDKGPRGIHSKQAHLADNMKLTNKNRKLKVQERIDASYGSALNYGARESINMDKEFEALRKAHVQMLTIQYRRLKHIWPTT